MVHARGAYTYANSTAIGPIQPKNSWTCTCSPRPSPHNPHPKKPTFLNDSLDLPRRDFASLLVGLLLVSLRTHIPHKFKLETLRPLPRGMGYEGFDCNNRRPQHARSPSLSKSEEMFRSKYTLFFIFILIPPAPLCPCPFRFSILLG